MTLLRDGKNRQIECDECSATTEAYDADDFQIMVESAKDGGWRITQDAVGDYSHTCPACRHGGRLARARAKFL